MSQWVKTTDLCFKRDSKSVVFSDGSYYVRGSYNVYHWDRQMTRMKIGIFWDKSDPNPNPSELSLIPTVTCWGNGRRGIDTCRRMSPYKSYDESLPFGHAVIVHYLYGFRPQGFEVPTDE